MRRIVVLLALSAAGIVLVAVPAGAARAANTVTATGTGTVKGVPDVAQIYVTISTSGSTASAALAQNAADVQQLTAVLNGAGIQAPDLQTSGLSLGPTFDQNFQVTGYSSSSSVVITLPDVSKAGAIIDAIAGQAGPETHLGGINLSIGNTSSLLGAARAQAVKAARTNAQQLAKAAGRRVGRVLSISEVTAGAATTFGGTLSSPALPTPISPGQQPVAATVSVVFALR
jgi:hypothetical protein